MTRHDLVAGGIVVLVEDDERHADLFQRAWQEAILPCDIVVAAASDEAIVIIDGALTTTPTNPLRLILLDLNLPGRDGRDTLRMLRADSRCDSIPIVILTTSPTPDDIELTVRLGANAYVVKPLSYRHLVEEVTTIAATWLADRPAPKVSR